MGIGPSHLNGMDQTGILVHSNVRLIAEVPCVPLLPLMRVRVPLLFLIFCGGWRRNDRGVHNGPFFEDKSSLLQKLHYLAEQLLLQPIAYQQIPKTPREVLFYVFYSTISASSRSRIAWSALQK